MLTMQERITSPQKKPSLGNGLVVAGAKALATEEGYPPGGGQEGFECGQPDRWQGRMGP